MVEKKLLLYDRFNAFYLKNFLSSPFCVLRGSVQQFGFEIIWKNLNYLHKDYEIWQLKIRSLNETMGAKNYVNV